MLKRSLNLKSQQYLRRQLSMATPMNEDSTLMTSKQKNNSILFCEGLKLKDSLIDLDKTYNLVDEINERQRR